MRVAIYWNLHRSCFSIRAEEGPEKGRVIAHADRVGLRNVTTKVSKAGRDKVRREGRKSVHAFVMGDLAMLDCDEAPGATAAGLRAERHMADADACIFGVRPDADAEAGAAQVRTMGERLTYNPYRHHGFVLRDGERPVDGALAVLCEVVEWGNSKRPNMLALWPTFTGDE